METIEKLGGVGSVLGSVDPSLLKQFVRVRLKRSSQPSEKYNTRRQPHSLTRFAALIVSRCAIEGKISITLEEHNGAAAILRVEYLEAENAKLRERIRDLCDFDETSGPP